MYCQVCGSPNSDEAEFCSRCQQKLRQVDGTATRRGVVRLIERENLGLSFGAYNHAFALHERVGWI